MQIMVLRSFATREHLLRGCTREPESDLLRVKLKRKPSCHLLTLTSKKTAALMIRKSIQDMLLRDTDLVDKKLMIYNLIVVYIISKIG